MQYLRCSYKSGNLIPPAPIASTSCSSCPFWGAGCLTGQLPQDVLASPEAHWLLRQRKPSLKGSSKATFVRQSNFPCILQLAVPPICCCQVHEQKVKSLLSIPLANKVLKTYFFAFLWSCTEGDDLQICPFMLDSISLFPWCSALCICQVIPGCNSFKTKGFVWCLFFNDWTVD